MKKTTMIKDFVGEKWATVQFEKGRSRRSRLEVSTFGRVKTTSNKGKVLLLNGTLVKGYRVLNMAFFELRSEALTVRYKYFKKQISLITKKIAHTRIVLKRKDTPAEKIISLKRQLVQEESLRKLLKEKHAKFMRADEKSRKFHKGLLIHRLVAEQFCRKSSPDQNQIIHLDHDKLNNKADNLRWATREEVDEHWRIYYKDKPRTFKRNESSKAYKLTSTKVMFIKKKIMEGVRLRTLSKTFKVSETQLLRIKRGLNWRDVKPAA